MTKWIPTLAVILLVASLGVTLWMYLSLDRADFSWQAVLAFRILWGCWIVALFAIILTRVTIFGWSFRRYFRWDEPTPPPTPAPRPTRAPWNKGGKSSFGFTVSMVSVTGTAILAIVLFWMFEGLTGNWGFWLACTIIGIVWWVTVITLVLTRVAIFGHQRNKKKSKVVATPPVAAEAQPAATPDDKPL